MSATIIPFDYRGQTVRFSTEGWLHATELAERFGKLLDHWLGNAETVEYIRALDEALTGHPSRILDTRKSGYVKTSRARADRVGYAERKADLLRSLRNNQPAPQLIGGKAA